MLSQLTVVVQLGGTSVSSQVFVEACRERGQTIGDMFFLHFDTLFDYGFLTFVELPETVQERLHTKEKLGKITEEWDAQFSLTHNGREFLERYGGR